MREPAALDDLTPDAVAAAALGLALCAQCGGARYTAVDASNPVICTGCGGDGLDCRPLGAIADAARESVPWLA